MLWILGMQVLATDMLESICGGRRTGSGAQSGVPRRELIVPSRDLILHGLGEQLAKWETCVEKQVADKGLTDPAQIQAAADRHCMGELLGPLRH